MKAILLGIVLILGYSAAAQKQKVINLKNGNSYFGIITSRDSGKVKFMGYDLNTYVFDTSEIASYGKRRKMRFPSERTKSTLMHDVSFGVTGAVWQGSVFFPLGIKVCYAAEKTFAYRHSIGAEFNLFINWDVAPTLGVRYRYEFLPKVSTPFIVISAGNYADPFWSSGLGKRFGATLGHQWGSGGVRRKYVALEFTRATGQYWSNGRKLSESISFLSVCFGYRL